MLMTTARKLMETCFFIVTYTFLVDGCADPTRYFREVEFSLLPPAGGIFDEDVYVIMRCNNSQHVRLGSRYSICGSDGTWSPAPLSCYGNTIFLVWTFYILILIR